jgi:uncharacterized protein YlxW (UPF0749 family)
MTPLAPPPAPDAAAPPGARRGYVPDFLLDLFAHPLDAGYADAAAARATAPPPSGPTRQTALVLRLLALAATGLLLIIAYQQTVAAQPESSTVRQGLVRDVRQRQADTDALQRQADVLRSQAARLRDAALVNTQAEALRQMEARTGLGAITGDGVVVTIADGPIATDPVTGQAPANDPAKVLDYDLQTLVNELWRDGAEAIAINGQRLTTASPIRRAGSAILVNLEPLTEPYRIAAVGPPSMAGAFRGSDVSQSYSDLANTVGLKFGEDVQSGLHLPAAPDPLLRYATVIAPPSALPASAGKSSAGPSAAPSSAGG